MLQGISIWMLFRTSGEDLTKAKNDTLDMLATIEEYGLGKNTFFGGEKLGMVDITVGSVVHWLEVIEETVEVKLFEASNFPKLHKWFNNFKEVPIIRKTLPDQHQMFIFFKKQRERLMEVNQVM
ncbi:Glutathione transferase GST 23 [Bienertia sinuspersici]